MSVVSDFRAQQKNREAVSGWKQAPIHVERRYIFVLYNHAFCARTNV